MICKDCKYFVSFSGRSGSCFYSTKEGSIYSSPFDRSCSRFARFTVPNNNDIKEDEIINDTIAASIGMETISLMDEKLNITPELLNEIDLRTAKTYHIFPLESTPTTLTIAVSDPLDIRIEDDLGLKLGKRIISKLAFESDISLAIHSYYESNRMVISAFTPEQLKEKTENG